MASRVAEFETPTQPAAAPAVSHPVTIAAASHHAYPPHPMHMHPHYAAHNPYVAAAAPSGQPMVKSEPVDSRFMLSSTMPYALPPLPGPTINGSRQLPPTNPGGQTGVFSFKTAPQPVSRPYVPPAQLTSNQQPQRLPQVDGPSESSEEDSPSPPPSGSFAPRPSHPSLPQPSAPVTSTIESEAINSDLDDSDTEAEDDADEVATHDTDIVFCTYDKVCFFSAYPSSKSDAPEGGPGEKQVEMYAKGWNDPHKRKGLPFC